MENTAINPWWFYFADVVNSVSCFLMLVGAALVVIGACNWLDVNDKPESKKAGRMFVVGMLFLFINIFIPNKETVIQMFVASRITQGQVDDPNIKELYHFIENTAHRIAIIRR